MVSEKQPDSIATMADRDFSNVHAKQSAKQRDADVLKKAELVTAVAIKTGPALTMIIPWYNKINIFFVYLSIYCMRMSCLVL